MGSVHEELVQSTLDGKVAVLKLVAESNRNALSSDMESALLAALDRARADGANVAIIRGSHGTFCSGYNVGTSGRADYVAEQGIFADCDRLQAHVDFLLALREHPLPTISLVEGYCVAGGTDLMLSTDIAIVAHGSRIGLPNVRGLGISLLSTLWPMVIGPMRTKLMMFTGDTLSGSQAEQWGLAALSVPDADIERTAMDIARRIALMHPALMAVTKRTSNRAFEVLGMHELLRAGIELDAMAHFTEPVIDFWKRARSDGIRAALKERDAPYAGDGLSALMARASTP